jgi:hypothetical protein
MVISGVELMTKCRNNKKNRNIEIVGSADNSSVEISDTTYQIFCNSALNRAQNRSRAIDCLFISDGLLLSANEILSQSEIVSSRLGIQKLQNIRISKSESIKNCVVKRLVVVTDKTEEYCIDRVRLLNIMYSEIVILSHVKIARMLFFEMKFKTVRYIFKQNFFHILKLFLIFLGIFKSKKIPFVLRPSTGVVALLFSIRENLTKNVILNGIGFSRIAFYPTKENELEKVESSGHPIDNYVLNDIII